MAGKQADKGKRERRREKRKRQRRELRCQYNQWRKDRVRGAINEYEADTTSLFRKGCSKGFKHSTDHFEKAH